MVLATMVAPAAESAVAYTQARSSVMRLLLAPEAAALLRVPPNRVYELAKRGVIPCVRIGRLVRFPEDKLLGWIAAGGTCEERERGALLPHSRPGV
jgi:excisionase family DNA binding protein